MCANLSQGFFSNLNYWVLDKFLMKTYMSALFSGWSSCNGFLPEGLWSSRKWQKMPKMTISVTWELTFVSKEISMNQLYILNHGLTETERSVIKFYIIFRGYIFNENWVFFQQGWKTCKYSDFPKNPNLMKWSVFSNSYVS